jgi:hypothetical protein
LHQQSHEPWHIADRFDAIENAEMRPRRYIIRRLGKCAQNSAVQPVDIAQITSNPWLANVEDQT